MKMKHIEYKVFQILNDLDLQRDDSHISNTLIIDKHESISMYKEMYPVQRNGTP